MAQEIINVGTNPNDGTGDTLRGAFVKTDNNFDDLYTNKQNTLISGTNIKTINGNSVLGSGNLTIGGITGSGTDNYIPRFNGTTALENSIIFDDGTNIGIGTVSPISKFNLVGGAASFDFGGFANIPAIKLLASGDEPTLRFYRPSGGSPNARIFQIQNTIGDLTFGYALANKYSESTFTEAMRITSIGNVGIGTSSPSAKLHVEGTNNQILISGGTVQSIGSFAGGTMISYDDSNSDWDLFAGVFNYNVTSTSFYLNSILVNDVSNSVIFGAKNLPNATTISNASNETLIGVYHENTTDWETAIYAKRNIYCEDGDVTTILTIAAPNSSIDLVAKIGYGSKFFIAKVSVMIDWDALTYTYKITNTNTTTFDDSNSLNIDFEFDFSGAEFVVQINNDSGNDIYANINANIL